MKCFFTFLCILFSVVLLISCGNKSNTLDTSTKNAEKTEDVSESDRDNTETIKEDSTSKDVTTKDVTAKDVTTKDVTTNVDEKTVSGTESEKGDSASPTITLNKKIYSADEEMTISFTASSEIADNGWLGIVLSDVSHGKNQENDDNDIDFDFLAGQTSGTTMLLAPHFKGNYDIRMSDPDTGKELVSVSFTVK